MIVMTAFGTVESAVEAMKRGAYDYITKPFNLDEVEILVERALASEALARGYRYLQESAQPRLEELIGTSPAMQRLFERIRRVAASDAAVLVTGETGTGKELVARAIHALSNRRDQLFVPVNCAAIPRDLLESELFGHVRGAFTGATEDREGKFELADGGTLFLDEIGDMPAELQAKILRVLEEGRLNRVGGNREISVDVRVISATHRNLEQAVEQQTFRQDLYYRLNVIEIKLPPLRERPEDIPLLAEHFLTRSAQRLGRPPLVLEADALELLTSYPWPGNVRELRNVCERLTVLAEQGTVTGDVVLQLVDLPAARSPKSVRSSEDVLPLADAVAEAEIAAIARALEQAGGNKAQAARLLGISERNLWYKIKKYGDRLPA
ncbi:MAG: sigma-54-dependent Fis family transcriptional regulator [Candidatus Dadabacteria bacterium]|nr:MAG: sigma-54-dependent Fis family transcriptional regulator [Candidatus Dadabacteria bacterium]